MVWQNGDTPLTYACTNGNYRLVKQLVDGGVDMNFKSQDGYTPLFLAVQNKHNDIVDYLLTKGAAIDEYNGENGDTALIMAAYDGNLKMTQTLVNAGASINLKSTDGYTPLYTAVQGNHMNVVDYLLNNGALVDEINGDQEKTALHEASGRNNINIVRTLVNKGANVNKKNKNGKTGLDLARENNHESVVEYLQSLMPEVAPPPPQLWTGFTQSDIILLDSIFNTEAPPGQLPPALDYACCPVCLEYTGRSQGCMYMKHKCTRTYHKELYEKYASPEGEIHWCTICGRICLGHRHYNKSSWDAPKPKLFNSVGPFDNDCRLRQGGGGVEEKLARFRALRNTALELQVAMSEGETYTKQEALNELVQQCWNPQTGIITKRIMTKKAWNRPTTNFPPNAPPPAPPAAAAPPANVNDQTKYQESIVRVPGEEGYKGDESGLNDTVTSIQFKHMKADGTLNEDHEQIGLVGLMDYIASAGEKQGVCFDVGCGGLLWPREIQLALDNPKLAPDVTQAMRDRLQAYKERFNGWHAPKGGRRTQRNRKRVNRTRNHRK